MGNPSAGTINGGCGVKDENLARLAEQLASQSSSGTVSSRGLPARWRSCAVTLSALRRGSGSAVCVQSAVSVTPRKRKGRFYQPRGMFVLGVAIAVYFLISSVPNILATEAPVWVRALLLASAVSVAVWVSVRIGGAGIYVHADGITVVNPLTTRTVPWSRIRAFSWGPYGVYLKVGAELDDGSVVPIVGLPVGIRGPSRSMAKIIDSLNEHLRDSRVHAGTATEERHP